MSRATLPRDSMKKRVSITPLLQRPLVERVRRLCLAFPETNRDVVVGSSKLPGREEDVLRLRDRDRPALGCIPALAF